MNDHEKTSWKDDTVSRVFAILGLLLLLVIVAAAME